MEHPCHRCSAAVEDGIAFCPSCGAPQIRVISSPDATAGATPAMPPGTPGEIQPAAERIVLPRVNAIDWSRGVLAALGSALLGGVTGIIAGVAAGVPQLSFLVWMVGGGFLAVAIYRRWRFGRITPGMGARLGVASGSIGFGIVALLSAIQVATRGMGELRSLMEQQLHAAAARSGDPGAQKMIERFLTPQGMATLMVLGSIFLLIGFLVLSSIGGVIGAMLFGNREPV